MKTITFLFFAFISFYQYSQTTYTYTGVGDWNTEENWSPNYPGTTIEFEDEAIISEGSEVLISSVIINGTLINRGILENNSTITNNGTLINQNRYTSKSFLNNNGTIFNENTFNNNSFLINEGSITNNGQLNNNSFFVNNSDLFNNDIFVNNAIINGVNTAHTNDFELSQIFSPGDSSSPAIGTYTFGDDLTISRPAFISSHIGSISDTDLIQVNGVATLSGSLSIILLNDYDPEIGTNYTILNANTIQNTFDTVDFPDLGTDKEFRIIYNTDSVIVEVVDSKILSLEDINPDQSKVVVYPNPASDILYVKGLQKHEKIAIYSALGISMLESSLSPLEDHLIVDFLNKGSYFLSIGNTSYPFIKD
ncbi:hypothetical protein GCM10022393_29430 [Aquimarina addita]|uniref:Secretion system C-terminal sorting domain-containing protein n=1 Tax=Aquimarina addita TaxID=870485 RepID=A0ABP6UMX0_9FLAO